MNDNQTFDPTTGSPLDLDPAKQPDATAETDSSPAAAAPNEDRLAATNENTANDESSYSRNTAFSSSLPNVAAPSTPEGAAADPPLVRFGFDQAAAETEPETFSSYPSPSSPASTAEPSFSSSAAVEPEMPLPGDGYFAGAAESMNYAATGANPAETNYAFSPGPDQALGSGWNENNEPSAYEPYRGSSNNPPPYQPPQAAKGKSKSLRSVLLVVAMLVVAIGGGFLGASMAKDSISAQVGQATEEKLEAYLQNNNTTVLYRSVETTVGNGEATDTVMDVSAVSKLAANSVVEISTEIASTFNMFGYSIPNIQAGAGSGLILSENGYLLTCYHVIKDATTITVTLRNGEVYEATFMGGDADLDIALLKIEAEGLDPVVLGDSSALEVGSPVVAIGNPLGQLGGTVTAGYISALEREVAVENNTFQVLQTDAAINGGNSGGGLFNAKGELIGLVNAKASSVGVEGLGFAIPIDSIKQDIEDLINYGYVTSKVALGVNLLNILDQRTATAYRVEELGVYILSVRENSNASYAGLQAFDRIISVDGEEISDGDRVVEIISTKSVGDTMQMVVNRNGELLTFDITLYASIPIDGSEQTTPTAF